MTHVVKCDSLHDLLLAQLKLSMNDRSGKWLYRGQAKADWKPLPSLFREDVDLRASERDHFADYRRRSLRVALAEQGVTMASPDELDGLAQHYGLKTSVLDFTYDPMVAMYFAVAGAMREMLKLDNPHSGSCSVYVCASFWMEINVCVR